MQNRMQSVAEERPGVLDRLVKPVHIVVGATGLIVFIAAAYGMTGGYVEGIGWMETAGSGHRGVDGHRALQPPGVHAFNWIVLGLLFANALLLIFAGRG